MEFHLQVDGDCLRRIFSLAGHPLHGCVILVMFQVTKDFRKLYKDNVVVEVLMVPAPEKPLVRKSRSLLQVTSPTVVCVSATSYHSMCGKKDGCFACGRMSWNFLLCFSTFSSCVVLEHSFM